MQDPGMLALERLAAHEKECAARYSALDTRMGGFEVKMDYATKLLIRIVVVTAGLVGLSPQAIPVITKLLGP